MVEQAFRAFMIAYWLIIYCEASLIAAPDQKTWMRSSNLAAFKGNLAPMYNDGTKLVPPPEGNGVIA